MYSQRLIEIKESIFLYLFFYGLFDLDLMRSINIFFNTLINEITEWQNNRILYFNKVSHLSNGLVFLK